MFERNNTELEKSSQFLIKRLYTEELREIPGFLLSRFMIFEKGTNMSAHSLFNFNNSKNLRWT